MPKKDDNPPRDWYQIEGFGQHSGTQFDTEDEAREHGLATCRKRLAGGQYPGAFKVVKYTSLSRIA